MSEEIKEIDKSQEKGFQVRISEGQIFLESFGGISDLEMIGLMNYVDSKRNELLQYMSTSPTIKVLAMATKITEGLSALIGLFSASKDSEKAGEEKTTEE